MRNEQLSELLLQTLQLEQDRARVYEAALRLGLEESVRQRWARSLSEARANEETLRELLEALAYDPEASGGRRDVTRRAGDALLAAMDAAGGHGSPEAAQLVACECVLLAESRELLGGELLPLVAARVKGEPRKLLRRACRLLEASPGEPLSTARERVRDRWLEALGRPAGAGREHADLAAGRA